MNLMMFNNYIKLQQEILYLDKELYYDDNWINRLAYTIQVNLISIIIATIQVTRRLIKRQNVDVGYWFMLFSFNCLADN